MTRRELLLASAFAPLALSANTKRPNVVLFVSDDQGFGDLSLHGNPFLRLPILTASRMKVLNSLNSM